MKLNCGNIQLALLTFSLIAFTLGLILFENYFTSFLMLSRSVTPITFDKLNQSDQSDQIRPLKQSDQPYKIYPLNQSAQWVRSIASDYDKCAQIVELLKHGDSSCKLCPQWPTPSFIQLVAEKLKLSELSELSLHLHETTEFICSDLNYTLPQIQLESPLSSNSLASALTTYFYVTTKLSVVVGDVIKIRIVVNDHQGNRTASGGGDYFKVRAEHKASASSVAASEITYLGNGLYSANIKTFWSGLHEVRVFFEESGHFVDVLKKITAGPVSQTFKLDAKFSDKSELRECNLFSEGNSNPMCNYSGVNGEKFYCCQPLDPTLSCGNITMIAPTYFASSLKLFRSFLNVDR